MIDVAAGGTINNKTPEEASEFIEEMSLNNYQWQVMRTKPTKTAGVYNVDSVTMLSNQVELLNKKIDGLFGSMQLTLSREISAMQGKMAKTTGASSRKYGTYVPITVTVTVTVTDLALCVSDIVTVTVTADEPPCAVLVCWLDPCIRLSPSHADPEFDEVKYVEYCMGLGDVTQPKRNKSTIWGGQGNQRPQNPQGFQQPPYQQEKKPNLEEMLSKFISIGQLSKLISERPQGSLPSNTELNPRKQFNAISTQDKEGFVEPEPELMQETVISKGKSEVSHNKSVNEEYKPRVPYLNATSKDRSDEQFGKFLKLLKKLHINLPFIEALSQMPNAMKFLRKLLANKRKLDEASHVELNAVCSAILQNKLPNKLKDPGSFTIHCLIRSLDVNNALADLGASINVMPYKMFKQLGLGKPKQTRMSIQLADKTIRFPRGIIEDVLVKVDKFIFPADFFVLDIEEETNTPLILGRPFLATAKRIIDVGTSELTLRVGDEIITLQARNSSITSNMEGNDPHHLTKTDNTMQPTVQRLSLKEVYEPCSNNTRRPIHEEQMLQIEELGEWRAHKPKTPDKPKLL
ncbi:hypothetical protein CXB51_000003 [Gossypium anomalum]|uniref:Aspartic peptidase DDI1-type domain-containing protein n=1 Tax=Gossypium anomalum TaxID=47600 RepID=A0A8J5ZIY2_9ROSI|nr:hypothetical protein CXB51_000003 [Gossypium anomalum]